MLSQRSAQALARLRAYTPPPTQWYNCPLTRRAAVLILLFPDRHGELKVVLTMRAATLRNYAGQVALPGGKADHLHETPFHTSRREAHEEIGLPLLDSKLPPGYTVEHLCELPTNLAKTELGVRPCVAFLSSTATSGGAGANETNDMEETLIPRLDPKEVAAVFTAPFHNFLCREWEGRGKGNKDDDDDGGPKNENGTSHSFYRGTWTDWHESRWRMHNFYVPAPLRVSDASKAETKTETKAETEAETKTEMQTQKRTGESTQSDSLPLHPPPSPSPSTALPSSPSPSLPPNPPTPNSTTTPTYYRVFGMTARILVDAARVAYAQEPDFEHNSHFGDEDMIARLLGMGGLSEVKRDDGLRGVVDRKGKL